MGWDWADGDGPQAAPTFGKVVKAGEAVKASAGRLAKEKRVALGSLPLPRDWRAVAKDGQPDATPAVVVVNSYAGSLVLAARANGFRVCGSYEDAGYGLPTQRLNFPDLEAAGAFADVRDRWPAADLDGAVVLAHPPCAAFSHQISAAGKDSPLAGVTGKKFQQTIDVLDYTLSRKCLALAVESVPKALEGARTVHDGFATRYGYAAFRIVQNARTFGVPQDRPRFWVVFVRRDLLPASRRVWVYHEPHEVTVGEVARPYLGVGEVPAGAVRRFTKVKAAAEKLGLVEALEGKNGYGSWNTVAARCLNRMADVNTAEFNVLVGHCAGEFHSSRIRVLDPDAVAPVLLVDSAWVLDGKPLTNAAYQAVMGYPAPYKFEREDSRGLLSRGTCPPVATWVARTVMNWVERVGPPLRGVLWLEPGETADVRP